jgi:hypothetical protein
MRILVLMAFGSGSRGWPLIVQAAVRVGSSPQASLASRACCDFCSERVFSRDSRIFSETIAAFLDEVGYRAIAEGQIDERGEDERIRLLCERMTARHRLKTYRQLYALGCRMDGIDHAIERLNKPHG